MKFMKEVYIHLNITENVIVDVECLLSIEDIRNAEGENKEN